MAPQTYSTIPATEEQPLSEKQAKSYKSILAGAAVASFILGVMAATAVTSPSGPTPTHFLAIEGVENEPACAGAKQKLDACTAKNAPGQKCDIDCAEGYANFDEAKGCANAGKGYCCKDTKPAKYPFTPNTK